MEKLPMYDYLKRPEVMSRWLDFDNGVKGFAESIMANADLSLDKLLTLFEIAITFFTTPEQNAFIQEEGLELLLEEVISAAGNTDLNGFSFEDFEAYTHLPLDATESF